MGDKAKQDPREGGHNIQQRETRRGTMGDERRQDHWEGGHTWTHHPTKGNRNRKTKGDKPLGKAGALSNKGKQEGVQWETRGDKTLGKVDSPSSKGK